jgi:myo-inositol-1(or 4)-monophosphatase
MSVYKKEYAKVCADIIFETYMQCNDVRRFGTCALELCYLASGKCDIYFEIRVFPWDYAAGYLILKEAGGIIHGLADSELDFSCPTVIVAANNRENYDRLSEIVNKHIQTTPYED